MLDHTVSDYAAITSETRHELRNFANVILSLAELMDDGLVGTMPEPQADCVAKILENARKMNRGLRQLSELNALDNQESPKLASRDVGKLLEEALFGIEGEAEAKGITVRRDVPHGLRVQVDQIGFHGVIDAVFSQAQDAIGENRELVFRALEVNGRARIEVDSEVHDDSSAERHRWIAKTVAEAMGWTLRWSPSPIVFEGPLVPDSMSP